MRYNEGNIRAQGAAFWGRQSEKEERMRLFIAVMLSEEMKKALIGVMHDLKGQGVAGSYTPVQNLHVTLAFLGEVKDPEPVKAVMDSLKVEKSRLSFDEFGNFGDCLWIGIKGNQKIKKYAADLRKGLVDAGLPCDQQKFQPHITLVRKQKGKRPQKLSVPDADMMISKVSLMRSEMKDGKRVYTEIYAVR